MSQAKPAGEAGPDDAQPEPRSARISVSPANAFANAFAGRCAAAAMTGDGAGPDPADEGEVVYTVERIVRSFKRNGERFYMVKWRGWSSRDNTVEPEDQLVALAQSGKIIWRGLPGRDPN